MPMLQSVFACHRLWHRWSSLAATHHCRALAHRTPWPTLLPRARTGCGWHTYDVRTGGSIIARTPNRTPHSL